MKKHLLSIICLLVAGASFAQDKPQKEWLPKRGDMAIGVDVIPLLKYVGNAFNGNLNNSLDHLGGSPFTKGSTYFDTDLMPDVSITGKYMLTDRWGLRANVGLIIKRQLNTGYVVDDLALLADLLSEKKNIDRSLVRKGGMSLMLGGEYRKGERKVQGVFSMGMLLAFQRNKATYDWGNKMTVNNQQPTIANEIGVYDPNGYRPLKVLPARATVYAGLTGSAGVEWFVAPKISIGAEVNLSAYYVVQAKQYLKSEGYNPSLGAIEKRTDLIKPANRTFVLGTESLGGSLNMTFFF